MFRPNGRGGTPFRATDGTEEDGIGRLGRRERFGREGGVVGFYRGLDTSAGFRKTFDQCKQW